MTQNNNQPQRQQNNDPSNKESNQNNNEVLKNTDQCVKYNE